jgi:hypothetical protein
MPPCVVGRRSVPLSSVAALVARRKADLHTFSTAPWVLLHPWSVSFVG